MEQENPDCSIVQPQPRRGFSLAPLSTSTQTSTHDTNLSYTPSPVEQLASLYPYLQRQSSELPNYGSASSAQPDHSFLHPHSAAVARSAGPDLHDSTSHIMPNPSPPAINRTPSSASNFPPKKSHSVLNLTSSTLLGIYSPTGYDTNREEPSTPWGTGAQTPMRNGSFDASTARLAAERLIAGQKDERRHPAKDQSRRRRLGSRSQSGNQVPTVRSRYTFGVFGRAAVLFCMGLAYGEFVTRLHDTPEIAPVHVSINRRSWKYHIFWGTVAVVLGSLLPWVDDYVRERWEDESTDEKVGAVDSEGRDTSPERTHSLGADWNPIVRTVGAFVGIAFAIRRLPWQSTLQVSLTLALVNPVIWYLIDRSKTGFALSSIVGVSGAAALISINPNIVPSPAGPSSYLNATIPTPDAVGRLVTHESIGVATWLSSVLFCSCVCFGNLGRRLTERARSGEFV